MINFFAIVALIASVSPNLPPYVASGHAVTLQAWLNTHPGFRLAVDDDCNCNSDIEELRKGVLARDTACVYCGVSFTSPPQSHGTRPSWEHIINDASIITRANIVRCCMSCNSSKGARVLAAWLQSPYCTRRGITSSSVAMVVQEALRIPSIIGAGA